MLLKYCEVNGHAKKAYRCCCGFEEMEQDFRFGTDSLRENRTTL